MNLRYYHDFYGADDVLNRFEILTNGTVPSMSIEASSEPFMIDYAEVKKLEPIRGAQATLNLICNQIFQFRDLHTDDMQKYQVRFYRDDALYWIGWLDSETYGEALADTPPYGVTFKASDFNITERLKYFDESDKRYRDIAPFITHLKRCFNKLDLPFQKLYIGCTTTANDISISDAETTLHVLYMMSDNFYDEDNEPMTCREVIESILQPFGLSMVQKDANVYIYDLNTVKQGSKMKRYDFASLNYEGEEAINFNLGNLHEIGFMSTDSTYEFEEMINNVTITSSLYAKNKMQDVSISENTVSEKLETPPSRDYWKYFYNKAENIENIAGKYAIFQHRNGNDIQGCYMSYIAYPDNITPLFRIRCPEYLIGTDVINYVNLKLQAYVNTRDNPFYDTEGVKNDKHSGVIKLYCNLYLTDEFGKAIRYYDLINGNGPQWVDAPSGIIDPGCFLLWFSGEEVVNNSVLDAWTSNSNVNPTQDRFEITKISPVGTGFRIPVVGINGYLVFEITNKCRIVNPKGDTGSGPDNLLPENLVKNIFLNDISLTLQNAKKKDIPTDDYEFKSYVNKKVSSDYDEVTLKCISANEEKAPIGKANILKKVDDHYEFQLSYSRSGQTDILERLLMCTIHSNFTTKNERCAVIIKMADNPALGYVDYNPILSGEYLVMGCTLNFARATTNLSVVGFSEDTAKLSSIPYE